MATIKPKFKDGKETDEKIVAEAKKDSLKVLAKKESDKVPFKAEIAYAALYPNGFRCSYQYVSVNIIFDGRTYMLSPAVADFIKSKIEKKAMSEINKRRTFGNPSNPKIGEYEAS